MIRQRYSDLPAFLRKNSGARKCLESDIFNIYRPLIAIWLLEMALSLEWCKKPNSHELPRIFDIDSRFCSITGVELPIGHADYDEMGEPNFQAKCRISSRLLATLLKNKLAEWQQKPLGSKLTLIENIELLGQALALQPADLAVLSFVLIMKSFDGFEEITSYDGRPISNDHLARLIAHLTGQKESSVINALREDSRLISSGLVILNRGISHLGEKFDLIDNLVGIMHAPHRNGQQLASHFLRQVEPANLKLDAFPHLATDIATLKAYLSNMALADPTIKGVNILFYGPPGTGKTELTKALATALGYELYEVNYSDETGESIRGNARLRAYKFGQNLLKENPKALLMFDEFDDVIAAPNEFMAMLGLENSSNGKAWINRTMEYNPVPAIWITNDPNIDPAYLRRFDYSVHFPVPPIQVRMDIVRHHFVDLSPNDNWIARVASSEMVSPGQYENAAKVARLAHPNSDQDALLVAERALDRSMRLMGQKRSPARNVQHTAYDSSFINADQDIDRLLSALKRRPKGSFCLYGPPGTGKSEFAHHIADSISQPLILRRSSDILSQWVGETEQAIAGMFMEARERDAVLLLDEADSFLTDRRDAQRSWEVTPVNELLTQMEAFDGIFICTTNLMQKLDQASLRRFAFKVKFDYLNIEQRWKMFCQELGRFGLNASTLQSWEPQLRRLDQLTPGDFAVVVRQYELWDTQVTAKEFLDLLSKECAAKGFTGRKMGF